MSLGDLLFWKRRYLRITVPVGFAVVKAPDNFHAKDVALRRLADTGASTTDDLWSADNFIASVPTTWRLLTMCQCAYDVNKYGMREVVKLLQAGNSPRYSAT